MTTEKLSYHSEPLKRKALDDLAKVIKKREGFIYLYNNIYVPALRKLEEKQACVFSPAPQVLMQAQELNKKLKVFPKESFIIEEINGVEQQGNKCLVELRWNDGKQHNALFMRQVICAAGSRIFPEQTINDPFNLEQIQAFKQETFRLQKLLAAYNLIIFEYENKLKGFITGERSPEYKTKRKALVEEKRKRMQEYTDAYNEISTERSARMLRGEYTKDLTEQGRKILAEKLKVQLEYDKRLQELSDSRTPTEEQKAQVDEWIKRNTELREKILKAVSEAGYAI